MRQLLLAAFGAAGFLLVDLPALAQLSNTTSTFSGQVAASCDFNLPENITLNYNSNQNMLDSAYWPTNTYTRFELTTNLSSVRIHVSPVSVIAEPPPYASSIIPEIVIERGQDQVIVNKNTDKILTSAVSTSSSNSFYLRAVVYTSSSSGSVYELPSGNYSYRATISCLQ